MPVINQNELEHRIPLAVAMESIANYKSEMAKLYYIDGNNRINHLDMYSNVLKAFLVNHADIVQILGLDPTISLAENNMRGYIGMDGSWGDENLAFRFFLVPVVVTFDEDGNKIYNDAIPTGDVIIGGVTVPDQQYVYDVCFPCPNTCDGNSLLFQAGNK